MRIGIRSPMVPVGALAVLALVFTILVPVADRSAAQDSEHGIESTWGLDTVEGTIAAEGTVRIPIPDWRLEGFENATTGNHRTASVTRTGPDARIRAAVPVAGTYYPAFVLYDTRGTERLSLSVDGVQAGTVVADWDSNRERLFFLTEARTFRGGETIELRALGTEGMYRIEALLLLRDRPAPRPFSYTISEVSAQPEETEAAITWITSWPAACTLEWSSDGGAPAKVVESVAANNHRLMVRNLAIGGVYRFRVKAESRDGKPVASAWQTFSTRRAPRVAGSVVLRRVPLVTHGEGSAAPDEAPVTSGLPFPKGELGSDVNLRLLDAGGRERPVQTRTLSKWADGTAKWVLLDFQAGASARGAFAVEYGTEVKRRDAATSLVVSESPEAVTVVTGPAKLAVGKRRFGVPESFWLDRNRDGRFDQREQVILPGRPGGLYLTGADGQAYSASGAPDEVVVEERGPLRAVVRVTGSHRATDGRKLFSYVVRVHAYAGKPYVRIQHTFVNDHPDDEFTSIRSLCFRLPLGARTGIRAKWAVGEDSGAYQDARKILLRQHTDDRYAIGEAGATDARTGGRAAGWAQWSDGALTATLSVRDFWQNYPKDLVADETGLELGICPPLRPDEYAAAKGTMDDHRLYYYLQGGLYKFRQGMSKTHDIWLDFQSAARLDETGAPPSPARARREPLLAVAPPEWYAGSKAFGRISPAGSKGIAGLYEAAFDRSFQGYLQNRVKNREYGMLNFGDWWGERVINWGNSEYDTQYGFLLQFARTGDLRYFRVAEEAELHNRDVDTAHAHHNPMRVGGVYVHAVGHTGDYHQESPLPPRGIVRGSFQVSHTFVEGHLYYYFLTGDRRSLETAIKIAGRDNLYGTRNFDFSDSRNAGWHLILTMAMYDATGDRYYLNAAKIIVERVMERRTPDGGWRKLLTPGHCACLPRHYGNAGFMLAVMLTGLRQYEEATGDSRIAPAIIGGARFLIDDMWVPEARAFRYTSCPKTSVMAGLNFLLFDSIVYAHQRTGDPRMRTVLIQGTDTALEAMQGLGKGFTQTTRVAPHFLDYLDRVRETSGGAAGN